MVAVAAVAVAAAVALWRRWSWRRKTDRGVAVDVRIVVGAHKHLSIALHYAGATNTIKCTTFCIVCGVY